MPTALAAGGVLLCLVALEIQTRLVEEPHPKGAASPSYRGSGTRHALEAVLVELSSTTAIKAAVEVGVGPAVLSSLTG